MARAQPTTSAYWACETVLLRRTGGKADRRTAGCAACQTDRLAPILLQTTFLFIFIDYAAQPTFHDRPRIAARAPTATHVYWTCEGGSLRRSIVLAGRARSRGDSEDSARRHKLWLTSHWWKELDGTQHSGTRAREVPSKGFLVGRNSIRCSQQRVGGLGPP